MIFLSGRSLCLYEISPMLLAVNSTSNERKSSSFVHFSDTLIDYIFVELKRNFGAPKFRANRILSARREKGWRKNEGEKRKVREEGEDEWFRLSHGNVIDCDNYSFLLKKSYWVEVESKGNPADCLFQVLTDKNREMADKFIIINERKEWCCNKLCTFAE